MANVNLKLRFEQERKKERKKENSWQDIKQN